MFGRNLLAISGLFIALALLAMPSQGAVIAYWNFNDANTVVDQGAGTISWIYASNYVNSNNSTSATPGADNGTTLNALNSDPVGWGLMFKHGYDQNGKTVTFQVSTVGHEDLQLTFAIMEKNAGFTSNQTAYSTNGSDFTDFGGTWTPTHNAFGLQTFDFSSIAALDNQANVYVRITFNGASGTNSNAQNLFDNIQFTATAVPEPATMALFGLGVLAMVKRRSGRA